MMACPFCAIVAGREEATVLDETEETLAIAPLESVSEGHLLVISKDHYESLFDVPDPTYRAVMDHVRTIGRRLGEHGFDGVNLLHASGRAAQQSVPHFHVHVAPRRHTDDLDLWPESSYEEAGRDRTDEAVRTALENDGAEFGDEA